MYQLRFRMNIQSYSDRPHVNTCIYSVNGLQNPYSHGQYHVFNPSKPFVITALIILILGSMIGSIWMMTIYGVILPAELISTNTLAQITTIWRFYYNDNKGHWLFNSSFLKCFDTLDKISLRIIRSYTRTDYFLNYSMIIRHTAIDWHYWRLTCQWRFWISECSKRSKR